MRRRGIAVMAVVLLAACGPATHAERDAPSVTPRPPSPEQELARAVDGTFEAGTGSFELSGNPFPNEFSAAGQFDVANHENQVTYFGGLGTGDDDTMEYLRSERRVVAGHVYVQFDTDATDEDCWLDGTNSSVVDTAGARQVEVLHMLRSLRATGPGAAAGELMASVSISDLTLAMYGDFGRSENGRGNREDVRVPVVVRTAHGTVASVIVPLPRALDQIEESGESVESLTGGRADAETFEWIQVVTLRFQGLGMPSVVRRPDRAKVTSDRTRRCWADG